MATAVENVASAFDGEMTSKEREELSSSLCNTISVALHSSSDDGSTEVK